LKIRATTHFCSDPIAVENPEDLQVSRIKNPKCNLNGIAPAPVLLDQQIDTMAIKYMQSQLNALIKELQKRIFAKNNRSHWFEIFLTTFVLLTTMEALYRNQVAYQRAQANMVCSYLRLLGFLVSADKISDRTTEPSSVLMGYP
jgi:hypothetical protein